MSDLTLSIRVENLQQLREVKNLVEGFKRVGPAVSGSLTNAERSVDGFEKSIADMNRNLTSGFSGVQNELAKLTIGLRELAQAAQMASLDDSGRSVNRSSREMTSAVGTVRRYRQELQLLYETQLAGTGASDLTKPSLQQYRLMGASLSPLDRQRLEHERQLERQVRATNDALEKRNVIIAAAQAKQWGSQYQGDKNLSELLSPRRDVGGKLFGRTAADSAALSIMGQQYKEQEKLSGSVRSHSKAVDGANESYQTLHSTMRGVSGGMGQVWLSWGKPLAALWAGYAVSSGIRESIKQTAAFQHELVMVQAVSGEASSTVAKLGEEAKRLGTEGIFGPQQLAEGFRILAQAGLSAQEALDVMPVIKGFATIGEMDVGPAAQSLIGITTAFGQPFGNVERIADVIGKAAAISQTSIENMTSAMRQASVVAEMYGADVTEVGAALSVLAKRNIDASRAGTALRNAYNEVYAPQKKSKELLEQMGVKAYDNQGKMRPFLDVMKDMKVAMEQLDKESQNAVFQAIFGERGGKVASAFLNDLSLAERYIKELDESTGFTNLATSIVESDSLTVQWAKTMNTLRTTFIDVGTTAKPQLTEISRLLQSAFNSDILKATLQTLVGSFASFAQFVTQHLTTIGTVFATVFGVRLIGSLAGAAAGFTATTLQLALMGGAASATQLKLAALNAQTIGATGHVTRFGAAAGGAAIAASALGTGVAAAATKFAAASLAISRFLPYVGQLISLLGLAAAAWAWYKGKQDAALTSMSTGAISHFNAMADVIEDTDKTIARLEKTLAGNGSLESALDPAHQRMADMKRDLQKEREKEQAIFRQNNEEAKKRWEEQQRAHASTGRNLKNLPTLQRTWMTDDEMNAQWAADKAKDEQRLDAQYAHHLKQNERRRNLEKQIQEKEANRVGLQVGTGKLDLGGEGGGGGGFGGLPRQYNDPIGKEFGSLVAAERARTQDLQDTLNDHQKIVQAHYNARKLTEDEYYQYSETLEQRRADIAVESIQSLYQKLEHYEKERAAGIDAKYKGKAHVSQMDALRAEVEQKRAELEKDRNAALRNQATVAETNSAEAIGRERKRQLEITKAKGEVERALMRETADYNLQFVDSTTQALEKRRMDIEDRFSDLRLRAAETNNKEWAEQIEQAYREVLARSQDLTLQIAKAEKDSVTGLLRGSVKLMNDSAKWAERSEQLVVDFGRSVEDVFVNMMTKGEFSLKRLGDLIEDFVARAMAQKLLLEPLGNLINQGSQGGGGLFGGLMRMITGQGSAGAAGAVSYGDVTSYVGLMHKGGVVGSMSAQRLAPASAFVGAPRFHSGGGVGLRQGEVPIIAKRGEAVLTEHQQAYVRGAMDSSPRAPDIEVNVTNNGQPADVSDVQTTFDGKKAVVNIILDDFKRNGPIARSMGRMR